MRGRGQHLPGDPNRSAVTHSLRVGGFSPTIDEKGAPVSADDNIKAVQAAYEGFGRDDLEPLLSILSEDFQFTNYEANPFGGSWAGPAAFEHLGDVLEQVEMTRFEIESILGDDERVVAVLDVGYVVKATGKQSAVGPTVHIMDFDDGKMTRFRELAVPDGGAWNG